MSPSPTRSQYCPDCGAACVRLPGGELVGASLWACVVGDGEDLFITRRGEVLTGRVIDLRSAPRNARIGYKPHECKDKQR